MVLRLRLCIKGVPPLTPYPSNASAPADLIPNPSPHFLFFFIRYSLTSIFLASKTEEQITNVSLLAKATDRDDLQILGKELILLQVSPGPRRKEWMGAGGRGCGGNGEE